jgi:hypothetical protein
MRQRNWCGVVVAVCLGAQAGEIPGAAEGQSRRREPNPLFHAFLWGSALPPGELDHLALDVRPEVSRRLSLRGSYKPRLVVPTPSDRMAESRSWKQVQFESFIVATVGDVSVQAEATAIARESDFAYEWEGMTGAARSETTFAEAYLRRHPTSATAPALQLFVLHRWRCEFEAATFNDDLDEQALARDAYRKTWALLQQSSDAVVRAVAEEIDAEPYVYIGGGRHPRTGRK